MLRRRSISLCVIIMMMVVNTCGVFAATKDYFEDNANMLPWNDLNVNNGFYYNGRTYIVYNGVNNEAMITYYDHNLESWGDIVEVGGPKLSVNNNHGTPTITVDDRGYIHVIYGGHVSNTMTHRVSTLPEDISSWRTQDDIFINGTYVMTHKLDDGSIYFLHRGGGHPDSWQYQRGTLPTTGDGPLTFSSPVKLLDAVNGSKAFYTWSRKGKDGAIHIIFIHHDHTRCSLDARKNLYYVKMVQGDDGSVRYYNGEGEEVTDLAPFTMDEANQKLKIFDSNGRTVYGNTIYLEETADGQYRPHIFANVNTYGDTWQLTDFTRNADNNRWVQSVIAESNLRWDRAIGVTLEGQMQVLASSEPNIARYTYDGSNWNLVETIADGTTDGVTYALGSEVVDNRDEATVLYCKAGNPTELYLWGMKNGESGLVTKEWSEPKVMKVEKDTFVQNGAKAGNNFGGQSILTVKNDSLGYYRRSFVKFNTAEILEQTSRASLKFYSEKIGGTTTVNLYATTQEDFQELSMNWNNQVSKGEFIASVVVNSANNWFTVDVTDYINNNLDKDNMVFVLESQNKASNQWVLIKSKESGQGPELWIE